MNQKELNIKTVITVTPDFDILLREYQLAILKKWGIKKTKAEIVQKFAQDALRKEIAEMRSIAEI